ncbi:hypothetical protein Ae406Ps2_6194c [Pseudonocardia sp. Ae406_Ps2]|nr:hypothetical protein Ae406Ps2_6194c [Pseudonocardia sp. Ae406_Ps2]
MKSGPEVLLQGGGGFGRIPRSVPVQWWRVPAWTPLARTLASIMVWGVCAGPGGCDGAWVMVPG